MILAQDNISGNFIFTFAKKRKLLIHTRWNVHKLMGYFSRRLGYAREACRAAMQSLMECDLEVIQATKDRDVWFTAFMPENDTATKRLTGQLGFEEMGYATNGRYTEIFKTKALVRCLPNAQGIYESVRAADVALLPRRDPWDRYWQPKATVADRVVLLPMTSADQTAFEAVTSASQRTGFARFLGTSAVPPISKTDLHLIVFSDEFQDRRSYGIFKLTDLVGLPSDMKATEDQQRKCIGLVTLIGQLEPLSSSPENVGPRRFNWELEVTMIPSNRKQGYGNESSRAAIKALFEEGAGDFDEKDYESQNTRTRPRFGFKGSQGLGEEVIIIGRFEKSNVAAKALLKTLGFHSPSGASATAKVQVGEHSENVLELMVRTMEPF
jgi:hypothetical protein